jgi:glycosyltransferase involved in cell wall biosynthesis
MFVVTRMDTVGGAQIHVRDIAGQLVERGWGVSVVTGAASVDPCFLDRRVQCIVTPSLQRQVTLFRDVFTVQTLAHLMRQTTPSIVSLHSTKAGVVGRVAARITRTPCIFTAHGWAFTDGVGLIRRLLCKYVERSLEFSARRIICVSEYDKSLACAAGMNPKNLITIRNGMPIISTQLLAQPGANARKCRIVMIARFAEQKDHAALFRALQRVPNVELELIGDGPQIQAARQLCHSCGLSDRVVFLGSRNDIAERLGHGHLFCLISKWEGFPRSTLEGMRAGLPTVVSNVGGAGEAVVEGQTGFVIPRGDIDTLAHRLSALANNAELRRRMGAAAREHFLANFTFDRMFDRTLQVYEDALAGRNQARCLA